MSHAVSQSRGSAVEADRAAARPRNRVTLFILALWIAFLARGAFHAVVAPMWDGFDEPGHLAYVAFIADHGRPPNFVENSFPTTYVEANKHLPSTVGVGAPPFKEWRAMTADQRAHHRAMAAKITTERAASDSYISGNYERQQGPLFYYLATPAYLLVESLPLPKILVAMRLYCVLLASLTIPLAARLLRLLAGRRGVLIGLPIVALLPNTPFAVFRVSNEALTWPLLAAIAVELVLAGVRRRDPLRLGILISAGIFTKLTLLPVFGAAMLAMIAARRSRRIVAAAAIPLVAALALMAWNKIESGTITGLVQETGLRPTTMDDVGKAIDRMRSLPLLRQSLKHHAWSGGWGFVMPPDRVYAVAAAILITAILAAVIAIRLRKRHVRAFRRAKLLIITFALLAGALVFHMFTGAIAAVKSPDFPTIGAEGWFFDMIRPIEAGLLAILFAAAIPARRTRFASQLIIMLIVFADLAGTTILMLPRWAGLDAGANVAAAFRGAIEAAPLQRFAALPLAFALLYFASNLTAAISARVKN
ncbi:MAG TPA: glycosyltransferase 87 family protein [Thermoanaerobaculia bacterium]|nr:glycosyltransferase 87 family protein [Thermoanaerobaculia bacterium]